MSSSNSQKLAISILAVCILALVIGVFNAAKLQPDNIAAEGSDKPKVSLMGNKNHLALIELSGMIVMDSPKEGLFESESNAVLVRKALDKAAKDDSIKGILLRVNTPGGTVGMSQELNAAVKRARDKKPVVVSMGDVAASGGYYTACAADKIYANPGTLTASIGVIIQSFDASKLLNDKLGVSAVTIKSGKFKDLLSPYNKPSGEQLALIQTLVDESYHDFLDTAIEGRTRLITDPKQKAERIRKIKEVADGRVVHGRQALASGLVDEIGDLDEAYTDLDQMAKERFSLKGRDRLPLQKDEERFNLMQMIGLEAAVGRVLPIAQQPSYKEFLPISMQYPNQPLWVLE